MSAAPEPPAVGDGAVAVADVVVGTPIRREVGDLAALMASMDEHGQLHPIGLRSGNRLLFGLRRLEAAKKLGWQQIRYVRILDREDALTLATADQQESVCALPMSISERLELARRLMAIAPPKARKRTRRGRRKKNDAPIEAGQRTGGGRHAGDPASKVSAALGMSRAGYERARIVARHADGTVAVSPQLRDLACDLLDELDRGLESLNGAVRRIREAKQGTSLPLVVEPVKFGPRPNHRRILTNLAASLSGLATAADDIRDLSASVTPEQAGAILPGLSSSLRSLHRIKTLLLERTQ